MTRFSFCLIILIILPILSKAQKFERQPIDAVKAVGDKAIRDVPFQFKTVLMKPGKYFRGIKNINFGRTFGLQKKGLAYAYSIIQSEREAVLPLEVSHNDGLKIWLNGEMVYEKKSTGGVKIREEERDVFLENKFEAKIKKGKNTLLIKSETVGKEWKVLIRPRFPRVDEGKKKDDAWMSLSIKHLPYIAEEVANLSNWFVIGPFPNENRQGLDTPYPPEKDGFKMGSFYQYQGQEIAWQIPKVEILGDVIDPDPNWGTLYDWNYHTAGFAWAMYQMGEYTQMPRYKDYLNTYCDFMLDIKPYVGYEKYTLNRGSSRHIHLWDTPLLDFTSAPTLPFIYRVIQEQNFDRREEYLKLVKETQNYLLNEQLRFEDGTFTRETPFKYTTWVDDMFMGTPFLLHAAMLSNDAKEKQKLYDDAANQVFGFHKRLYDSEMNLYHHAQYSERPEVKLPYWSRANGWAIWATSEVLLHLPKNHPQYHKILKIFQNHVAGIVTMQDPETGFYHNVLNRPQSFKETSGTAIFTMAIARGINQGWLNKKKYGIYALKGWQALDSVIEKDGTVTDICMGTMCTEDEQYYFNRPVVKDDSHGLLGLIFAGIEVQKFLVD